MTDQVSQRLFDGSDDETNYGGRIHYNTRNLIDLMLLCATDGARELIPVDQNGDAFRVQPPAVSAIDATGAGDAFRAALLAGLLKGQPLPRAVCWGVAAGALKVQHLGAATNLPPPAEIVALAGTLATEPVT